MAMIRIPRFGASSVVAFACLFLTAQSISPAYGATGTGARRTVGAKTKALSPLQKKLYQSLKIYILRQVKKNYGFYPIEDKEFAETWMAELVEIDTKKIRRVFEDEYIIRARFREKPMNVSQEADAAPHSEDGEVDSGEDSGVPLKIFQVDFNLERTRKGSWRVKKKALYSIDDAKLFAYSESNERIPLERDSRTSVFAFEGEGGAPEDGEPHEDLADEKQPGRDRNSSAEAEDPFSDPFVEKDEASSDGKMTPKGIMDAVPNDASPRRDPCPDCAGDGGNPSDHKAGGFGGGGSGGGGSSGGGY